LPELHRSAKALLKGPPIYLKTAQAELLLTQFQETAVCRGWELLAVSIMANHFHLVVKVSGDPDHDRVLADFKAYGTRALNRAYGKPASETWGTGRGSKRKLPNEGAVTGGVNYVLYKQAHPLVVWSPELGRIV
jgi:REP element-mobilizing transposase RayT